MEKPFGDIWDGILLDAGCEKLEPITKGDEELDDEFGEAAPIRVRTKPIQPSKKEVEEHEAAHCPYINWCR